MFPGWDKVTPPVRCYMKLCDCRRAAPPVRRVCIGLFHARKMFRHIKAQSVKSSKLVVKSIWNPANVLVFQGFFGIIKIFGFTSKPPRSLARRDTLLTTKAILLTSVSKMAARNDAFVKPCFELLRKKSSYHLIPEGRRIRQLNLLTLIRRVSSFYWYRRRIRTQLNPTGQWPVGKTSSQTGFLLIALPCKASHRIHLPPPIPHQFWCGISFALREKAGFLASKVGAFSVKFTLTVTVTVTRKFCGQQATATCFVRNE